MTNQYGWLIASLWYTTALFATVYPCVTYMSKSFEKNVAVLLLGDDVIPIGVICILADLGFGLSCYIFLQLAKQYGEQEYAPQAPKYLGAFQLYMDGTVRKYPSGFIRYLPFAFLLTFLLPALMGLYLTCILGEVHIFLQSLAGYLIVFSIQIAMETTRLFNRNQMTSSVPFSFGLYRFWQIARGLILCTQHLAADDTNTTQGAYRIAQACLLMLLSFWVFDHAVTSTLLPWMLNVQCMAQGKVKKSH